MSELLLANDSMSTRTTIRQSLEVLAVSSGSEAAGGIQARAIFGQEEFDLMLAD